MFNLLDFLLINTTDEIEYMIKVENRHKGFKLVEARRMKVLEVFQFSFLFR